MYGGCRLAWNHCGIPAIVIAKTRHAIRRWEEPTARHRYLFAQKLSDYQIERVLAAYAGRITASDFLAGNGDKALSRNTVYSIYDLVRRRLLDIGYYTSPEEYWAFWMGDPERRSTFPFSNAAAYIDSQEERMRGTTAESARYVLAEIIFAAENPTFTAAAFLQDIKLAVRITGFLNRPPQNIDIWHSRSFVNEVNRQINDLRMAKHPAIRQRSAAHIASLERVRSQALASLRHKMRARNLMRVRVLPKP